MLDNFVGRITNGYVEHAHKRKYKLYEVILGLNGFFEIIKGQREHILPVLREISEFSDDLFLSSILDSILF